MTDKTTTAFPDVDKKLQAATKQSVFERQKQEAEAKRLRDEAETAAVLQDFVKSFDDEDVPPVPKGFNSGFGAPSGPPRRHFGGSSSIGPGARGGFNGRGNNNSGPGSLGPVPNGPARKRPFEGFQVEPPRKKDWDDGRLQDDYHGAGPRRAAFDTNSDDENQSRSDNRSAEPPIPKPTLRLASLPSNTSPAVVKALIPSTLTIDGIRMIPPPHPLPVGERKSMSAIVTLSKETPANDIDTVVGQLQNRYLGYGFYLSLHRHLSSAALSSAAPVSTSSGQSTQPFGAKPVNLEQDSTQRHMPPGQRGFAPPTSYTPYGQGQQTRNQPLMYVPVVAPRDIKELKLIHKTVESLLIHGPEFEALLMSRPEVQREEKWAWLWDSRSTGGVWYRWRLWEVLTGSQTKKGKGKYLPVFEESSAWKAPDAPLPFEYTTSLDEFVSDSEYNSDLDDDSGDEGGRRRGLDRGGPSDLSNLTQTEDGNEFLNPLEKAKLTHLLARLPISTGKLFKGDISRITAFAISHAGRGADEVVASIISNIERPFAYTSANPDHKKDNEKGIEDDDTPIVHADDEEEDTSSAKLIALFVVSDLLSSSSTSGVRHAWRYRQLFESGLKNRRIFENLGRLDKKSSWGRLRAEKWKRSVGNILSLWEGWCVFPQESQDFFTKMFHEPPLSKAEEEEKMLADAQKEAKKGKWKSVEDAPPKNIDTAALPVSVEAVQEIMDLDGVAMTEDDDLDGVPMDEDEDIDGVPMEDEPEAPVEESVIEKEIEKPKLPISLSVSGTSSGPRPPNRRPRAVDMFADSGSDGE